MRIDRLTSRLQEAIADAQSIAVGKDHNQILPAHLLLALLTQRGGSTRALLAPMGVDLPALEESLQALVDNAPSVGQPTGDVQMSQELSRLLNIADKYAQANQDEFISSELVLLAAERARAMSAGAEPLVERDNDKNPVVALREIAEDHVTPDDLREDVITGLQIYSEIDEQEEEAEIGLLESAEDVGDAMDTMSEEDMLKALQGGEG